ncbi:MAG: site-specific DNA-methyltransferase [Candidatus Riflebacteria bacterium]|nr:site-specific DNA-methyltransferase [Candidatus Riflebacteria bacterium]
MNLSNREKLPYGLNWPGKSNAIESITVPANSTFILDTKNSLQPEKSANLAIEGDNLEAMKLLLPSFREKIKLIYIDPPYNTGNDFIYKDNFVESTSDYKKTSLKEKFDIEQAVNTFSDVRTTKKRSCSENIQKKEDVFQEIAQSQLLRGNELSGRFHSKWLNMIYPRLFLAKFFLTEDGVMLISIGDSEIGNLLLVCNEIFGEENVELMIWNKVGDGDAGAGRMKITRRFRKEHEFILCCYKNRDTVRFNKTLEMPNFKNKYRNADNDPRGAYKAGNISKVESKSNPDGKNFYEVISPKGRKIHRQWHFSKEEFDRLDNEKRIYWGKDGNAIPQLKIFLNEPRPMTPVSILLNKGSATTGNKELRRLFGKVVFENSKPIELMKYLIEISTEKDSVILDFFAGSFSTAHAVLGMNKQDGGSRKFIMIQVPEPCRSNSRAFHPEFQTVFDIGIARLKRVIENQSRKFPTNLPTPGFQLLRLKSI